MSSKGIFTAVSGAIAQTQKLDTIANNIANVNTPAFKRDEQLFREYLTAYERPPDVNTVPRVVASVESFYDMQGGDKSFVEAAGTQTHFSQGGLKATGNVFDVALEGSGFFEVLTPQGPRLTRNGAFTVDGQGRLVTKDGNAVLLEGAPGADPESRAINLTGRNVTISYSGEVYDSGNLVGRLSLIDVGNKDALQKVGSSLYTLKNNLDPQLTQAASAQTHQGYLEGSNVNLIQEMTDMIATQRVFESTQKAIQSYDQMEEKLVNQVPRLG